MTAEEIRADLDGARLLDIVRNATYATGCKFELEDVAFIADVTARKCEINKKDRDYFYILLENELRDFAARKEINRRSAEIMRQRSAQKIAAPE